MPEEVIEGWHTPFEIGQAFVVGSIMALYEQGNQAMPAYMVRVGKQLEQALEVDVAKGAAEYKYADLSVRMNRFAKANILVGNWGISTRVAVANAIRFLQAQAAFE